ncbi:hypothetical protein, partial [Pseudomonas savastanoi]|uniref:hypothetical protein n=1 Tax=Pseudomonas savastanoi TaxID=29438 RepID=UPI001C7E908E
MAAKSFFYPSPTPKNGLKATFLYLFQILDAPLPYQAGTYLNCAMLWALLTRPCTVRPAMAA